MAEIQVKANRPDKTFSISGLDRAQLELVFMALNRFAALCEVTWPSVPNPARELYTEMNDATKHPQAQQTRSEEAK